MQGEYPGAFYQLDGSENPIADPSYPVGSGHYLLDSTNPLVKYSNYPYPADTPAQHDAYVANHTADTAGYYYQYDSGYIDTGFNIPGITRILGSPYEAGLATNPSAAPALSGEPPILGTNVGAVPYTDAASYWKSYNVVLHKEAFPLFSKRIQVTYYNASGPSKGNTTWNGGAYAAFDFSITIYYNAGGTRRILYQTAGTVTSPYTVSTPSLTVTAPTGATVWSKGSTGNMVSWVLQGDSSQVYEYRVFLSADGATWNATPVTSVRAPATTVAVSMPDWNTSFAVVRVTAYSSSGAFVVSADSEPFTVGSGSGGTGAGPVVIHIVSPTSTVAKGTGCSISWTTSGDSVLRSLITGYQVTVTYTAGGSDSPTVTSWNADGGSVPWTPSVAGPCTIEVTALGPPSSTPDSVTIMVTTTMTLAVNCTPIAGGAQPGDSINVTWGLSPAPANGSTVTYAVALYDGATQRSVLTASTSGTLWSGPIPTFYSTSASVGVTATVVLGSTTTMVSGSSSTFQCVRPVTATIAAQNLNDGTDAGTVLQKGTTFRFVVYPTDDANPLRWSSLELIIDGKTYSCTYNSDTTSWGVSVSTSKANNHDFTVTAQALVTGRGIVTIGSRAYTTTN